MKKSLFCKVIVPVISAFGIMTASASADTLVTYVPGGSAASSPNNSPINAFSVSSLVTATTLTNVAANATSGSHQLSSGGSGPLRTGFGPTFTNGAWMLANDQLDGAATPNLINTFNFTLSVNGTQTINLTSLSFDYGIVSQFATTGTNSFYAIYANVDGAGFNQIGSTFSVAPTLTANSVDYLGEQTIDLSSIVTTQSVQFAIWVGSASVSASEASIFQNIMVNGTAAVPEPSEFALAGLGCVGCYLLRFRRK